MNWRGLGREIAVQLEGLTDESAIRGIALATIEKIKASEELPDKRENAKKAISAEIRQKFPRLKSKSECVEANCLECYYHDPASREEHGKWRHLIFKYLKLDSADYDAIGGESRAQWKAQQQKETEQQQQEVRQQAKPVSPVSEALTIDQFQLDSESQQLVQEAIALSGMTLADFTRQALRVYAKTITGKTRKQSEDLATVPTDKLLNNPTYSTHPGRAEELTKRAIKAIKYYNANIATEQADRWCITQSAIASLTGSRPSTVGKVLEQFKDEIESHNVTYGLNDYSNRKRGKPSLTETIDLAQLVPDGLD
jgi:hypothetical protein